MASSKKYEVVQGYTNWMIFDAMRFGDDRTGTAHFGPMNLISLIEFHSGDVRMTDDCGDIANSISQSLAELRASATTISSDAEVKKFNQWTNWLNFRTDAAARS